MNAVLCTGKIIAGVMIITYIKDGKVVTERKVLAPKQQAVRGLVS